VEVLRRCCLKFRDIFIAETTVDPFESSLTIASACNRVFRKLFLKPDTIGIIPFNGYQKDENQSAIALKWIKWISHKDSLYIRHKLNGGEVKIGEYKVDGYCEQYFRIYEFHGCYWHGCPNCMKKRNQLTGDYFTTAKEAYERTIHRISTLRSAGYAIVELWECDLQRHLATNPEMREFFDNVKMEEPLNARDGMFMFYTVNLDYTNYDYFFFSILRRSYKRRKTVSQGAEKRRRFAFTENSVRRRVQPIPICEQIWVVPSQTPSNIYRRFRKRYPGAQTLSGIDEVCCIASKATFAPSFALQV
jgi:hypothetical protein